MKYFVIRTYFKGDTYLVTVSPDEDDARAEIKATKAAGAAREIFAVKYDEVMALERLSE